MAEQVISGYILIKKDKIKLVDYGIKFLNNDKINNYVS